MMGILKPEIDPFTLYANQLLDNKFQYNLQILYGDSAGTADSAETRVPILQDLQNGLYGLYGIY